MRRTVKEIFEKADGNRGGTLDKEEFNGVCEKAKKLLGLTVFDLEKEWASIKKVPARSEEAFGEEEEEISFSAFEAWWKDRAGIQEPDIPVLPEYMVMRIAEKAKSQPGWQRQEGMKGVSSILSGSKKSAVQKNWAGLGAILLSFNLLTFRSHFCSLFAQARG